MAQLRFGGSGLPDTSFTHTKTKLTTIEGIRYVAENGLDALELAFVRNVYLNEQSAQELYDGISNLDIALSVHAPYYINLNPKTPKAKASSKRLLLFAARIGSIAGAKNIIFHPASYLGMPPELVLPTVKENLLEIADELLKEKIAITLRPEIGGKLAAFGTLDELISLPKERENILPCIDFAHVVARSNGKNNSFEAFCDIFSTIQKELGNDALQHMHIHFAGVEYNEKGEIKHLNIDDKPASESLDYQAFARSLAEYNVGGTVVCESPQKEKDALTVKKVYESYLH